MYADLKLQYIGISSHRMSMHAVAFDGMRLAASSEYSTNLDHCVIYDEVRIFTSINYTSISSLAVSLGCLFINIWDSSLLSPKQDTLQVYQTNLQLGARSV